MAKKLTHIDKKKKPQMVNVGDKKTTKRFAHARGAIFLPEELAAYLVDDELMMEKGPVFQTAIIAGTMGVKKTQELIPFCHQINLENIKFDIYHLGQGHVEINCEVTCDSKTGVEMEALTGVSIAALTIYDMCKALSHEMEIGEIYLVEKTGGKCDYKK